MPKNRKENEWLKGLERRLQTIKEQIGMIRFQCYVCGDEAMTYKGCLTVPPDPLSITSIHDVRPVATCKKPYCRTLEQRRQDAIVQSILAPQRERYLLLRQQERERDDQKERRK